MPSIDHLKVSTRNCFDYNIVSDLIKCFTTIFFFDDFFFLRFDDLMLYLSGSYGSLEAQYDIEHKENAE